MWCCGPFRAVLYNLTHNVGWTCCFAFVSIPDAVAIYVKLPLVIAALCSAQHKPEPETESAHVANHMSFSPVEASFQA